LKSLKFRDIDRRSDHVDARHGGAFVVYVCVDTKPHSTAIVMVMSDDGKEAERLRVAVQDEIKKAKGF
jgi:hypothetical protein